MRIFQFVLAQSFLSVGILLSKEDRLRLEKYGHRLTSQGHLVPAEKEKEELKAELL